MTIVRRVAPPLLGMLAFLTVPTVGATAPDAADSSIRKFLAHDDTQPSYRATRRLEARNGTRTAWLEALTEYGPETGFTYEVTAEGGSSFIRRKVLRAVLDGERDVIANGETSRSSIDRVNYILEPDGIDDEGLANVLLSPRRKERVLVSGRMLLQPDDGRLVRLQGQLAKNPSFWIKDVEIVRSYNRIDGVVVPVAVESNAQVRFLGLATLHMTYVYSQINGQPVSAPN